MILSRIGGGLIGAVLASAAITISDTGAGDIFWRLGFGGFGLLLVGAALFATNKQIDHWFGGL